MSDYLIALNNLRNPIESFDENSVRDQEKIRSRFLEKDTSDIVLYKKGDKSKKGKIVGQDELEPGVIYVWFTNTAEGWKDPELLQNAIFSAEAVYKDNPFRYLKEKRNKDFHTIVHIVDFGNYKLNDGNHQTCLVALSKSPSSDETALVISFKGSTTKEDWLDNLSLSHEQDNRYVGKFHCGFLKRGNSVNVESFLSYAEHYKASKIIRCGHSLDGAVSSVVHMNLIAQNSDQVNKKNILNFHLWRPFLRQQGSGRIRQEKVGVCFISHQFSTLSQEFSLLVTTSGC